VIAERKKCLRTSVTFLNELYRCQAIFYNTLA
jgi:hypothetical protein